MADKVLESAVSAIGQTGLFNKHLIYLHEELIFTEEDLLITMQDDSTWNSLKLPARLKVELRKQLTSSKVSSTSEGIKKLLFFLLEFLIRDFLVGSSTNLVQTSFAENRKMQNMEVSKILLSGTFLYYYIHCYCLLLLE